MSLIDDDVDIATPSAAPDAFFSPAAAATEVARVPAAARDAALSATAAKPLDFASPASLPSGAAAATGRPSSGAAAADDGDEEEDGGSGLLENADLRFAADDATVSVPYPPKYVAAAPRVLFPNGTAPAPRVAFCRLPHPRHAQPIVLALSQFASAADAALAAGSAKQAGAAGSPDSRRRPRDDDESDTMTPLLPSTAGNPLSLVVCPVRLWEVQHFVPPPPRNAKYGLWFLNDTVEPSGTIQLITPMHPAFMALMLVLRAIGDEAASVVFAAPAAHGAAAEATSTGGSSSSNPFRTAYDFVVGCSGLWLGGASSGGAHHQSRRPQGGFYGSDASDDEADRGRSAAGAGAQAQHVAAFAQMLLPYFEVGLRCVCEARDVEGEGTFYRAAKAPAFAFLEARYRTLRSSPALERALFGTVSTRDTASPSGAADAASEAGLLDERAFGLLSEYVPQRLHAALRAHLASTGAFKASGTPAAAQPLPMLSTNATVAGQLAAAGGAGGAPAAASSAAKSLSVRRLEKAGAPRGTPSIMSFFAKKS
jgi:hypothetical protein